MQPAELMTLVVQFLAVLSAIAALWWRVEAKVKVAEDKASEAMLALAAHKLHVSETYATKQGMQEQTAQLLRAIEGVGNRIDGLHERLDRAFEHRP